MANKKTVLCSAVPIFPSILSSRLFSPVNECAWAEERNNFSKPVNRPDSVPITIEPHEQPGEENPIGETSRRTGRAISICKEADAIFPLHLNP